MPEHATKRLAAELERFHTHLTVLLSLDARFPIQLENQKVAEATAMIAAEFPGLVLREGLPGPDGIYLVEFQHERQEHVRQMFYLGRRTLYCAASAPLSALDQLLTLRRFAEIAEENHVVDSVLFMTASFLTHFELTTADSPLTTSNLGWLNDGVARALSEGMKLPLKRVETEAKFKHPSNPSIQYDVTFKVGGSGTSTYSPSVELATVLKLRPGEFKSIGSILDAVYEASLYAQSGFTETVVAPLFVTQEQ